ncbi:MAG TPA: Gmad2 immunoglobulin-like domain-containing protein [Actinomycetota bacterium]|nr:Gmad2 immunoglobulin-like domain-containing protein [Actinomycetota bacterium]
MKRLIGLVIGLGLLAAGCAGKGAEVVRPVGGGAPSASPSTKVTPTPKATASSTKKPPASGGSVTYEVWFTYGEHLFVTQRTEPFTVAVGRAALEAMLEGPSSAERKAGVGTTIPAGTKLLGLNIEDGIATVDMSGTYDDGGGSLSERMRLAQMVYTITQFSSVQGVNLRLDGKAVDTFSGEGIVLDHPQTRADYDDLLPAILVESPIVGQPVSSPVTVSGTADVFEATVSIRILDASGEIIAESFATATCGTGCRGTYSAKVGYHVDHDQQGTVMVYEASAKDGSPTNVVKIPVTLTA